MLVKVACLGLQPRKHLGRSLAEVHTTLLALEDTYGCNACGEGGEFETLTLDCPAFEHGRIELQVRARAVTSTQLGLQCCARACPLYMSSAVQLYTCTQRPAA